MQVTIDRIEGNIAVVELEDGTTADLPLVLVPNAKEGMTVTITADDNEDRKRRQNIKNLMDSLFE